MDNPFETITLDALCHRLSESGCAIGAVDPREYHAWKRELADRVGLPCVSKSSLMDFVHNPYVYKWNLDHGVSKKSKALSTGSLIDCLTLTPEMAADLYTTEEINARTKDGKARKAELEAAGIVPVSPADMEAAQMAAKNARFIIDSIGEDGWQSQVGMWMVLDRLGASELATPIIVTGMLDACPLSADAALIDLKSTSVNVADAAEINRNMASYHYGIQAALYCDLFKAITGEERDFAFVFVGTEPPCQVRCVGVRPDTLSLYRSRYMRALADYADAVANNDYGSVELEPMTYEPPAWEVNKKGGEQ